MSKQTLHQFYLDLIPNLLNELFFFLSKNEIREDIIEKVDFFKKYDVLDKVYVIDYYQGPIEYKKGRNNNRVLLKGSNLEQNIFNLIEKRSEANKQEFDYVLNKYFELVEYLFFATNWMNTNLAQIVQTDDTVIGLFHLQFMNYKKHFEALVRQFYPNREAIPKGNFNAHEIIETYFPDVLKSLEQNNSLKSNINNAEKKTTELNNATHLATTTDKKTKSTDKKVLITEEEAEKILLKTFFNINIKD
ncbi:hypothetical protein [Yeosuana marina]|uniref:hypothetical protein n=1 Tax=Yeosuana marina TaxID=1565536 RepID=UPI0014237E0F|nr:hypothetical protein [Yeosuana marina]|tara:strand:+ start:785 stop:1525 length:741 start_codon:yes stop_codon:yes gene_type:complete